MNNLQDEIRQDFGHLDPNMIIDGGASFSHQKLPKGIGVVPGVSFKDRTKMAKVVNPKSWILSRAGVPRS